ncbi:MAG: CDP-alcohol phosphatidyltransferase family protein [Bacteroidota bacterium]
MLKKQIPNLITLLNLSSGIFASILAVEGEFFAAACFVLLGIFFDFFDGFAARLLKVSSEMGLQLDSLADMVTSGLVPGIVLFQLIRNNLSASANESLISFDTPLWAYAGFLVTLGSAYRLAKFNIDDRQTDSFIGLPTPANALFILSIPLVIEFQPDHFFAEVFASLPFLISIAFLSTFILNAEIALFSLKFKSFKWKENWHRFLLILISVVFIILFKFAGVSLLIVSYILLSLFLRNKQ